ncbi:hypothetical protein IV203_009700 [Nitzschia inconspicua]|uniref:Uncharacterized protein n=1 Tax=Nitzschia inconspicua TaxID=303405 RepID=A0A9K3KW81_9STRA|nr:hypothetical protein IV203_009700 [Nitzschia inconspicua]
MAMIESSWWTKLEVSHDSVQLNARLGKKADKLIDHMELGTVVEGQVSFPSQDEIERNFSLSYNPLHSFGLPVRVSEKFGESSCMLFSMLVHGTGDAAISESSVGNKPK